MNHTLSKNMGRDLIKAHVTKSQIAIFGSMLGLGIVGITPAQSATFTYNGTTVDAPTWHRPALGFFPTALSSGATAVGYSALTLNIDTPGTYTLESVNSWDDVIILYQDSFDPTNPLNNVILGLDSANGNPSDLSINTPLVGNLAAGNYVVVMSGFSNSDAGAFINTISGPGNISAVASTSVPEPFTIIGSLIGGTAAVRMRKKLVKSDKV